ncbi:recombinase family protein [Metabacillus litoralis]|uniref:recombinase family protein n=1 Tax=Metabacillus litoralis TaxID=152268 RepID=UPI001CFC4EA4|nr:recombinase family protein [Metabacillus litoralis]
MYRVGAYGRVSTGRKEQDSSLENQQLMFNQFVNSKGWELAELYIDRKTGTKGKRPELLRLLEDIKNKRIDVVIVKDLSRLARNGELSYKIANLSKEKGVHIISLDGMVNTMENNVDMLGILAWMYEKESENQSRRIKSSKKARAIKGKYQGSVPPYGYRLEDGTLYIREDETPSIVRRIYKEYLEGTGVDTIAKNLTLENVATPAQIINKRNAGLVWGGSTIKVILENPHYVGNLVQGRTETISVVSTGRKTRSKEELTIVRSTHEAIILKADFDAVQAEMIRRKKNITAPKLHLFTNVTFCADCGRGMWYRAGRKGYICGTYGRYGKSKCSSHSIKEEKLTAALVNDFEMFLEVLNIDLLFKKFESKFETALNNSIKEIEKVKSKIEVLNNRKVKYIQMLADGQMDVDTFTFVKGQNEEEIIKLSEQLKGFEESSADKNYSNIEKIKEEFLEFLFSEEAFVEVIHRFISRIEIEEDGTAKVFYSFQEPQKMNIA